MRRPVANQASLSKLEDTYPDPSFRRTLFDLLNISMLLTDSIITKDYVVPPALHAMIGLTDYGQRVYDQMRKRGVPFHEARLLCFLEMYHTDLLIDVAATDHEGMIKVLDKQVFDRTLTFPFIFGRLLYDKYFEQNEDDPKRYLNPEETQQLLSGTPQGVSQFARLVTGPCGILRSRSPRLIQAGRHIPLRHCSDPSCGTVHHVLLSTNSEAPINRHRETLGKILEREDSHNSAWGQFVDSIAAEYISGYQDWASEPIILLIGDALADVELRKIFDWLLDNSDGYLRNLLGAGLPGLSQVNSADMSRAQLLQLILTEESDTIISALDRLVAAHLIAVPFGEIRIPVVNHATRFGRHGLRAELARFGVRVRSTGSSLAPLRARRLVEQMYRLDQESDRQELDWQMRDEPSDSLEAKLEHYLQHKPPKEAMGNLVLARRSNVVVATTSLRLGSIASGIRDDDLINAVLWKLGFALPDEGEVNGEFWRAHESMLQQTRHGLVSAHPADREDIRGAAATYFTALERLLDDSLAYAIWALTSDHYRSPKPFVYRPHIDRMEAFKRLNEFDGRPQSPERLGNKNTLFPLTRGFARLALYLQSCADRNHEFERPAEEFPEWVDVQSLERFPFVHTMAFLDLMPNCQVSIPRVLEEITSRFTSGQVSETRNEWLHGQRTLSMESLDRLREGVDDVREAVHYIEENGFARQRYSRVSDVIDGDDRRTVVLASPSGRQISVFGPSPFAWLRLPLLSEPQYVMNSARFAEPAECLRFTMEVESLYSKMWDNYPHRPRLQRGRAVAGQPALPSAGQGMHS